MPKTPLEGVERRCEFHTIELGCALQRLFSTFPDGWPGFGLLTLRLGIGIALIYFEGIRRERAGTAAAGVGA